ncbi:S41 family peptidase, partial [Sphingorhabdus sp.]|uniref:S41 family peptidase n=1 Tax=Sphingorhabdus sp. TaxID=1902408 RepID=UPI003C70BDEC
YESHTSVRICNSERVLNLIPKCLSNARISVHVTALLLVLGLATLCVPPLRAEPATEAVTYFDHALALIKSRHINSRSADWVEIERRAQAMIADAKTTSETHEAIRQVLHVLKEPHSSLITAAQIANREKMLREREKPVGSMPQSSNFSILPEGDLVGDYIARVILPSLSTLGEDGRKRADEYAGSLKAILIELDHKPLCGWIIDLRTNRGGNMWPMLKGLDPLLGSAPFGYFTKPDGTDVAWNRSGGHIFPAAGVVSDTTPAFVLQHANLPIAVFAGPQTSSSGEMVLVALKGRTGVRVFGKATAGFTTANATHRLSDGSVLVITESAIRDRQRAIVTGAILPDVDAESDTIETEAIKWLESGCPNL